MKTLSIHIILRFVLGLALTALLWSQLIHAFDPMSYRKAGLFGQTSSAVPQPSHQFNTVRALHQRALRS